MWLRLERRHTSHRQHGALICRCPIAQRQYCDQHRGARVGEHEREALGWMTRHPGADTRCRPSERPGEPPRGRSIDFRQMPTHVLGPAPVRAQGMRDLVCPSIEIRISEMVVFGDDRYRVWYLSRLFCDEIMQTAIGWERRGLCRSIQRRFAAVRHPVTVEALRLLRRFLPTSRRGRAATCAVSCRMASAPNRARSYVTCRVSGGPGEITIVSG